MKRLLLLTLMAANLALFAQTTESVSMGPGYADDIYYSFANGVAKTENNTNWDIAFTTQIVDASILINEGAGVELYVASNDTADFATVDTTGHSWNALHNSVTTWSEGAFNDGASGHPDYGWGEYNNITHNVFGSKVYFIKLQNGDVKKMMIRSMLTNGDFTFRMADLDGSNEMVKTINKGNYSTKNFVYFSIANDSIVDREPAKTDWDMVITRYKEEVAPGSYYPVTGVLISPFVTAAKAAEDTTLVDYRNYTQTDSISIIGSDWKEFNMGTFAYDLDDSLSFFVQAQDGNLYKLIFKEFDGSSTGDIAFTTSIASAIGISENEIAQVNLYPNPATDRISITTENSAQASIISMNGALIKNVNLNAGENQINLNGVQAGVYIVRVIANNKLSVSRLVIQ